MNSMQNQVQLFEAIETSGIIVLILYIIIVGLIAILLISLLSKWRQRRVIAIRHLSWSFASYLLTFVCLSIGILSALLTGYKQTLYRVSMGMGYFFFMIAHVLFLFFAKDVYGFNRKYLWKYVILGSLIAIALALPQNYYGVPTGQEGEDNIRLYTSIAMLAYSLFIFTRISLETIRGYKKIDLNYARYGFLGFFIAQTAMILVFLFVLVDFIYWQVKMLSGYTVFYYLAVVFGMISIIGFYFGIIYPSNIQKRQISMITKRSLLSLEDELPRITSNDLATPDQRFSMENLKEFRLKHSEKPAIVIQCPKCYKHLYYEIPKDLISRRLNNPKDLVSISIPSQIICPHTFVVYIDRQFAIRSSALIDHTQPGF